jgi:hypothetical protein
LDAREVVEAGSLGKPKKASRLHRSIEDEGRYIVKKISDFQTPPGRE